MLLPFFSRFLLFLLLHHLLFLVSSVLVVDTDDQEEVRVVFDVADDVADRFLAQLHRDSFPKTILKYQWSLSLSSNECIIIDLIYVEARTTVIRDRSDKSFAFRGTGVSLYLLKAQVDRNNCAMGYKRR